MDAVTKRRRTSNYSKLNAIRNPDGIWINSKAFSEEAAHFRKHGYYTPDPWGSPGWTDYWTEQQRRCIEGYSVGGAYITGHHYNYLNFSPIQRIDAGSLKSGHRVASKTTSFPDFYDGDYNYFHALNIARNGCTEKELQKLNLSVRISPEHIGGGKHMIVGKARRKGYSFKNASICANVYNTVRDSLSLIGAFDKAYLYGKGKGTMVMASNYLNFYNEHTGWAKKREFVDKQENKKASYKLTTENGSVIETGYKSEILAITFKDNPDAARGKDPYLCLLEEIGAWPNFKQAWSALSPGLTAGAYITGQAIMFGTGGDMEAGTLDFSEMFYNPTLFNLMPFYNIWDEDAEDTECGFFHPMQWNREGFMDEQGNSQITEVLEEEKKERERILKKSSGTGVLETRMQEFPTCPSEAFLTVSVNDFPITELRNRLNKVLREELYLKKGQPVYLYRDEFGEVKAKPDLEGKLVPIWFDKPKTESKAGAVIIYEYPVTGAPRGLYKIGYDPYRQDKGTSLASIIVYKASHKYSYTRHTIVAEYTGRPQSADEVNRIFELLCELYNTEGMYENEVTHVKSYFNRRKKLHLLAAQPDQVISNSIKDSKVDRLYGCHMNDKLKDTGEKYLKDWLLEVRDIVDEETSISNIDLIYSPGFLEQCIKYHRKGNFDRVSAMFMVLIQLQEEELEKEYGDISEDTPITTLGKMIENMNRMN